MVRTSAGGAGTSRHWRLRRRFRSHLIWSALATVNYVLGDRFSVSVGYKVLDVGYDHKGHVYDIRLSSPVLGMTCRF